MGLIAGSSRSVTNLVKLVSLLQWGLSRGFYLDDFHLVVAIATRRYHSEVERIPEHIPVVMFVSCRVDSLMFERSLVFPREELRCIIGLCRRHFRYF